MWERAKPFREHAYDFSRYFARSCYGSAVSILRIPTTLRKFRDDQLLNGDIPFLPDVAREGVKIMGCISGAIVGVVGDGLGIRYIVNEIREDNYIPLIIAGAAIAIGNTWSGLIEAHRAGRRESLESTATPVAVDSTPN